MKNDNKFELSEVQYNKPMGITYIICGVSAIIGGIFTIGIIIGIFAIIGGLACLGLASLNLSGFKTGQCPYCNNDLKIKASSKTVKCPHCKKISTIIDNGLKRID